MEITDSRFNGSEAGAVLKNRRQDPADANLFGLGAADAALECFGDRANAYLLGECDLAKSFGKQEHAY